MTNVTATYLDQSLSPPEMPVISVRKVRKVQLKALALADLPVSGSAVL
jgi:hypothetical protein